MATHGQWRSYRGESRQDYGRHYHTKSYLNKNQKVTFNSIRSSGYLDVMSDVPFVTIRLYYK